MWIIMQFTLIVFVGGYRWHYLEDKIQMEVN